MGVIGGECTDSRGTEHSILAEGSDVDRIKKYFEAMNVQVRRVEEVSTVRSTE
jgi:hypothetical protein